MEYKCSICDYKSSEKKNVLRHINRRKSCGSGIKEVLEITKEIKCEYCNKPFSTAKTLTFHVKNNCSKKEDAIKEENLKLKEEIRQLKEKEKESTKKVIFNDNRVYNITIVNYEDTNLDKIIDKTYNKIIQDAESYQIIPRLIEAIHFDPNIPENHNVYISNRNKNNKFMNVYRDNHWEIANKDTEIENIISDKENNLSDWIDSKGEKYPEALGKFNEYFEQKYEHDIAKLIKEEVELVLYNNRHLIKN